MKSAAAGGAFFVRVNSLFHLVTGNSGFGE